MLAAVGIYVWALATGGALHLVALYATYCVVALVWIAASVKWFADLDAPGRASLERNIAIAMVAAFLLVAAVLVAEAAANADAVRQGRSAYPTVGGMRFASWGAERATLRWVGGAAGNDDPALTGCLMYLGTSDGTAYIYRADTKETLRLPASDVAVVTRDVTLTCERR